LDWFIIAAVSVGTCNLQSIKEWALKKTLLVALPLFFSMAASFIHTFVMEVESYPETNTE